MVTNVLEYLENSAARFPDKVFLADEHKSVTFSEAENIAKRIGSYLIKKYPGETSPLSCLLEGM